jgi:hypothetical protein
VELANALTIELAANPTCRQFEDHFGIAASFRAAKMEINRSSTSFQMALRGGPQVW